MRANQFMIIVSLGLTLCACGRSKETQFYMLNPLPPQTSPVNHHALKIGIDAIQTPAFTEKPQIIIYKGLNQVQLHEFHQWAETLNKNINRVIKTNLNTLLPKALLEIAPWDIEFKPDYNLKIDISEFKIDVLGNSSLRATYIISHGQVMKKYDKYYHLKLPQVTFETLIKSMNYNLNHLSQDIAHHFSNYSAVQNKNN